MMLTFDPLSSYGHSRIDERVRVRFLGPQYSKRPKLDMSVSCRVRVRVLQREPTEDVNL